VRRISILLAALAALMLVPAAGAFAANTVTVIPIGEGSGEVESASAESKTGEPPIECSYNGETEEASGECGPVAMTSGAAESIELKAHPAAGSGFVAWSVEPKPFISAYCANPGRLKCSLTEFAGTKEFTVLALFEPLVPLTVETTGSGSGEVECSLDPNETEPPNSTFGACEAEYAIGNELALRAKADEGSEFTGWTGCDSEEEKEIGKEVFETRCLVTMSEAKEVEADFTATAYNLAVSKTGSGTGTVTSEPAGINCGSSCSHFFEIGAEVTLEAAAEGGSEFTGWTGCDAESEGKCEVTMSEAKEVEAEFEGPEEFPLTVKINKAEGSVVSNPAGIECSGPPVQTCEAEFEEGTEVTLTASPAEGTRFNFWVGCPGAGENGRQCTLTMDEAKEVKAFFIDTYDLTISRAEGSEYGEIKAIGKGSLCPYRCSTSTTSFTAGEEITLATTTYGEKHFAEFTNGTGDAEACDGLTECTFTVTETDSSVEGLFVQNDKATLSMSKEGGGEAKVRAFPGAFECLRICSSAAGEVFPGTEITVTWELAEGTDSIAFSGEAGDCPASSEEVEGECHIEMDEDHSFVATLE
jgi:hypothetical protein